MPTNLAVFVHGWGAGHEDWWGTTRKALQSRSYPQPVDIHFHRYDSSQRMRWRLVDWVKGMVSGGGHVQGLGELGQQLWSELRNEFQQRADVRRVLVFGHSFGGLVIADALRHGAARVNEGHADDAELMEAISAIALCCSPLQGADLARTYQLAAGGVFARNRQIENLLKRDRDRREVVNTFVNFLATRPRLLTVFRATGDAIVAAADIYTPLQTARILYADEVLEGGHSDCIRDIGPAEPTRRKNFEALARWITAQAGGDPAAAPAAASPAPEPAPAPPPRAPARLTPDAVLSFEALMDRLDASIAAEPYLSWAGSLRAQSGVDDEYLVRIFLQQLIYAAARINGNAAGSANLWVAQFSSTGALHLRSEEREGYFSIEQLVDFNAFSEEVTIRANKVLMEKARQPENSAGGWAHVSGLPQLVAIGATTFPSRPDQAAGVSHVLGIPLYSAQSLRHLDPVAIEGAPLAVTVDFRFAEPPSETERALLAQLSHRVTEAFLTLSQRWVAPGIRLQVAKKTVAPAATH